MGYYLSPENEAFLLPYIKLLRESNASVQLSTPDGERLAYLLRNAANTRYPELKDFRFKVSFGGVVCVRKHPAVASDMGRVLEPQVLSVVQPITEITEYLDYFGVLDYLTKNTPPLLFSNAYLTEREHKKLEKFCVSKSYTLSDTPEGIRIT